jgi:hypothetical protein
MTFMWSRDLLGKFWKGHWRLIWKMCLHWGLCLFLWFCEHLWLYALVTVSIDDCDYWWLYAMLSVCIGDCEHTNLKQAMRLLKSDCARDCARTPVLHLLLYLSLKPQTVLILQICLFTQISYKRYTFGFGQSKIKGTSLEETCTFSATNKLPLEEYSWKLVCATSRTSATNAVRSVAIRQPSRAIYLQGVYLRCCLHVHIRDSLKLHICHYTHIDHKRCHFDCELSIARCPLFEETCAKYAVSLFLY